MMTSTEERVQLWFPHSSGIPDIANAIATFLESVAVPAQITHAGTSQFLRSSGMTSDERQITAPIPISILR